VIEAALDNQPISHYLPEKTFRKDTWLKGDYLYARSERFFGSILKKRDKIRIK
jgi:hypothetical protein